MKKTLILTLALLSIVWLTFAQTRNGLVLTDTQAAIDFMYTNGLTKFNTTSTFMATQSLRRDEAAAFFARFARDVLGMTPDTSKTECNAFTDLAQGHNDLQGEMIASCQLGLMKWSNGKFMPKDKFTNAQALTVIVRLLDGNQPETGTHWASNYLARAKVLWLTSGLQTNSSSNLDAFISRGDVAKLIEAGNVYTKQEFIELDEENVPQNNTNNINTYFSNYNDPIDIAFHNVLIEKGLSFINIPDHIQSQVNGPYGVIDVDWSYRFTISNENEVCQILNALGRSDLSCYDQTNWASIYIRFGYNDEGNTELKIYHYIWMIQTVIIEDIY